MAEMTLGFCLTPEPTKSIAGGFKQAVGKTDAFWLDRKIIPVYFMDGSTANRNVALEAMKQWTDAAAGGIAFERTTNRNAPVRVAFEAPLAQPGRYFSAVGKDALQQSNPELPTLNLGYPAVMDRAEKLRLALHEFGHALGLIHEHSSPDSGIVFKPNVYDYFWRTARFTRAMVDMNILQRYSRLNATNSEFDEDSIMLYHFPAEIVERPVGGTKLNMVLSRGDKEFIRTIYGGKAGGTDTDGGPPEPNEPRLKGIPLGVGDPPKKGMLVIPGETIPYHFVIEKKGKYTIETHGTQAWELALYAADDPQTRIAFDVGGGDAGNAKLDRIELKPGVYYLYLSHFIPEGVGSYSITLRKS